MEEGKKSMPTSETNLWKYLIFLFFIDFNTTQQIFIKEDLRYKRRNLL